MARRSAVPRAVLLAVIGMLVLQPMIDLDVPRTSLGEQAVGVFEALDVGQNQTIEITTWPNSISEEFSLEIPSGEALTKLNFSLSPRTVQRSDTVEWDQLSDWSHSMALNDNVDYNQSGLRINSPPAEWGFENVDHGWSLDANGGWAKGVDSAGANTGSQAIYTYSGDYPNYMSTTYWATSPSIDCSTCGGGWELKFWKRLGVESSSWDHAYVQVKGTGGWSTIWQNSGTIDDTSYSQSSYRVDSYIMGNIDFRIRFGLGPTDSSVTFDGWNIDDVGISPIAGSGTGAAKVEGSGNANWTSPAYGAGPGTLFQRDPGPFGLLNIMAEVPSSAGVVWTMLDAQTNQPIPGYLERTELSYDLGEIDWESHPLIRIKLHIWSTGVQSPVIHSISIGDRWVTELLTDPFSEGWTENGSWNGNQLTGSGVVGFPQIFSSRPLTGIELDVAITGGGQLEVRAGDSGWAPVANQGYVSFDSIVYAVSLRWVGAGDWTIDEASLILESGNLPLRPALDIGIDGLIESSLGHPGIGFWGLQDRLSDGSLSRLETLTAGSTHITEFWVPQLNLSDLCLSLIPEGTYLDDLEIELTIGQNLVHQFNITQQVSKHRVCLDSTELDSTNALLPSLPPIYADASPSFVLGRLKLTGPAQTVWVGSLSIPYSPEAVYDLDAADTIVQALNDQISKTPSVNGIIEVSVPLSSELRGAFRVELFELVSVAGMLSSNLSLNNLTTPLTASWPWLELNSTHQISSGVIDSIQYDFHGSKNRLTYIFPITGGPFSSVGNASLLEFEAEPHRVVFNAGSVDTSLRFRLSPNWDDAEQLQLKVRLIRTDAERSIPQILTIGSSTSGGVENDIEIHAWNVINDLGASIPISRPFLKAGSDIIIEVQLAFEDMAISVSQPKSGDVEVYLLENGIEVNRTSLLDHGRANFVRSITFGPGNITYRVGINPLFSQEDRTNIIVERTFIPDSLSPLLIDSNVARFDHRSPSPTQLFAFEVYDRPQLPTNLALMLWAEWLHDLDGDGSPSIEEYSSNQLYSPSDLSLSQGIYSAVFDDTAAEDGDLVYGFVVGSDIAGNRLVGGGSAAMGDELFIYQVRQDGGPTLHGTSIFWENDGAMWLNPGLTYELVLPFDEPNGISDLAMVRLDLTGPLNSEPLLIEWNEISGVCETESLYLVLDVCNIHSRDSAFGPFNPALELRLEFHLTWHAPFSEQQIHEPSFEVIDRSGQTSMLILPQLRWRYSDDLYITPESLVLTPESGSKMASGIYLRPDISILAEGQFVFSRTGIPPASEFQLEIGIGFSTGMLDVTNGAFSTTLQSPSQAGNYPLVLILQGLPTSVEDMTSFELPSIVVDDTSPSVNQINSPRVGVSLDRTQASLIIVELQIQETIMMSSDDFSLHWVIAEGGKGTSDPLYEGVVPLEMASEAMSGLFDVTGLIDLTTEFARLGDEHAAILHVWVEGTDAAGNPIDSATNSMSNPLASWDIPALSAELEVTDITYSKTGSVSRGESITVVIDIKNKGSAPASTNLTVVARSGDGETEIARIPIEFEMGASMSFRIDWAPDETGVLWLEVRDDGAYLGEGPTVTVVESDSNPFSSFEGVDSKLLGIFAFLLIFSVMMVIVILRGDARDDDEWDGGWEDETDRGKPAPNEPEVPAMPITRQPAPPPQLLASLRKPPR